MNEESTLRWYNEFIGQFTFQKHLLPLNLFEVHITDELKMKLIPTKAESLITPRVCATYIQVPD